MTRARNISRTQHLALAVFFLFAAVLILWPTMAFAQAAGAVALTTTTQAMPQWVVTVLGLLHDILGPGLAVLSGFIALQVKAAFSAWVDAKTATLTEQAKVTGVESTKARLLLELLKVGVFVEHQVEAHLGELKNDLVEDLADGTIDENERAALIAKWKGIFMKEVKPEFFDFLKTEVGGAGFDTMLQGFFEKAITKVLTGFASAPSSPASATAPALPAPAPLRTAPPTAEALGLPASPK